MNSNENEQKNIMDLYADRINDLSLDPNVTASNVGTKINNIIRQAEYDFHQDRIDVPDEIIEACKHRGFHNTDNDISKKNLDNVFLHHSRKPSVNPVLIQDYPTLKPDNTTFNNRQL